MATKKDESFYTVLGVSETASDEQIKKAHKRQYIKWHPDRAPAGERQEYEKKCKRINEAYAVLSDPSARAQYDAERNPQHTHFNFGSGFENFSTAFEDVFDLGSFFKNTQKRVRDLNVRLSAKIGFRELYYGNAVVNVNYVKYTDCTGCSGSGWSKGINACRNCGGTGVVVPPFGMLFKTRAVCQNCRGTGKQQAACKLCNKEGIISVKVSKKVALGSIKDKSQVMLRREGHQIGGQVGDLLIDVVSFVTQPGISIKNGVLHVVKRVPYEVVAARKPIDVKVLDSTYCLELPPVVTNDQTFLLPNSGLLFPGSQRRGDLVVTLVYPIPHTE